MKDDKFEIEQLSKNSDDLKEKLEKLTVKLQDKEVIISDQKNRLLKQSKILKQKLERIEDYEQEVEEK
jgi:hypothetical protein